MPTPSESDDASPVASTDRATGETTALEDVGTFQKELRALIHDQLQLAALEVRLATHSLMAMVSAAVCMGALLVVGWVGLMAAIGLSLLGMGLHPVFAILALTALTMVPVLLLRGFIVSRSERLGFPATLRTLKSSAPAKRSTNST